MLGFGRIKVVGESMHPTIKNNSIIYIRPYFFWEHVNIGDIVVLRDPRNPSRKILKRIRGCTKDTCTVLGDNPQASTDSRNFGNIPKNVIIGKII